MWGILSGDKIRIEVDLVIAMELVAEFVTELGKEAGFYQRRRGRINTWLTL